MQRQFVKVEKGLGPQGELVCTKGGGHVRMLRVVAPVLSPCRGNGLRARPRCRGCGCGCAAARWLAWLTRRTCGMVHSDTFCTME